MKKLLDLLEISMKIKLIGLLIICCTSTFASEIFNPESIECFKRNITWFNSKGVNRIYANNDLVFTEYEGIGDYSNINIDYLYDKCNVIVGKAKAFDKDIIVKRGQKELTDAISVQGLAKSYKVKINHLECDHDYGLYTNRVQIYYKDEIIFTDTTFAPYKLYNSSYSYNRCLEILERARINKKVELTFFTNETEIWDALE